MDDEKIAIIACLKMEDLYIKEWLDWHISIGIDHFYLCDNNDKDYQPKLEDVVKEYIDKGIVEVFDYRGVHPIQPICYTDIYDKYGHLYDWWLVIDIDEFIDCPCTNNDFKKFVKLPQIKNKLCVALLWRYYGDNDLLEYDGRGCLERFTKPATAHKKQNGIEKYFIKDGISNITKSLFRGKKIKYWEDYLKTYKEYPRVCHQHNVFNKQPINRYDVLGKNIIPLTRINIRDFNNKYHYNIYSICYLKHFITKTIQEYIDLKINRGDTLKPKDHGKYPYNLGRFFGFSQDTEEKRKFLKERYGIERK